MNENDRAIVVLVMLAHGMVHTYELSIPIFIPVWLDTFDAVHLGSTAVAVTSATLGILVAIGYGLFGLGALPGGILVDKLGSRRLIIGCLAGMAGSFLLLGIAGGLLTITLGIILWGVSASVYHPAGLALISRGVKERGSGFAYHGMAGNIGIGVGPLITVLLLLLFDWQVVATLLALPALFAAAYAYSADFDEMAVVETATDGGASKASTGITSFAEFRSEAALLFTGSFALVFVIVMFSGLYYRGILTFMPNLLQELPQFHPVAVSSVVPAGLLETVGLSEVGARMLHPGDYFYTGLLMLGVVGQYVGGKLTDRIPVEYGLVGGFGALGLLAILFLPAANVGAVPFLAVGAVLGVTLFFVQPFYQASVAEYTPAGTRGLSYGFTYLGVFGVGALGGAIAGVILEYANAPVLFTVLSGFAFLAATIALLLSLRASEPSDGE